MGHMKEIAIKVENGEVLTEDELRVVQDSEKKKVFFFYCVEDDEEFIDKMKDFFEKSTDMPWDSLEERETGEYLSKWFDAIREVDDIIERTNMIIFILSKFYNASDFPQSLFQKEIEKGLIGFKTERALTFKCVNNEPNIPLGVRVDFNEEIDIVSLPHFNWVTRIAESKEFMKNFKD